MEKQQDVMAILKLYELRRDAIMREARAWYFSEFAPKNVLDIVGLYRNGERASAHFRMVTSFWDMAAAFVLHDGIDEKMFLDSGTEHIFVYAKVEPFLAEIREIFGEPEYLLNLERLVQKIPDFEKKLENRRRLIKLWTTEDRELSAAENS